MSNRTAWESAANSSGVTSSERYLAKLARKAFLSLWSYPNLYTDEGRRHGKGDGKELCDLLVIFGKNVLLFSDKHCEFPTHSEITVSWSRWYRRAVEKSARQLAGAESFIKAHPTRIFLDKDCEKRLPIALPKPEDARYFLIAVTRGSNAACARYFGGGSSGSLLLDTGLVGASHVDRPFHVGFPLASGRVVHVLDEMTVDVLLEELNTVPDFIAYLKCKEELLLTPGVRIVSTGEEQLLARYMCTLRDGQHALPPIPDGTRYVLFPEGDWEHYSASPQRAAKVATDGPSFLWDSLIEYQSSFIRAGTAITLPYVTCGPDEHEQIVRALADEPRLARRQLASSLKYAVTQSEPGKKFARIVISPSRTDRAYVFLTVPPPRDQPYEAYRELRTEILSTYCHGVKLKIPAIREVIGIASEPMTERRGSQDFLYCTFPEENVPEDVAVVLRESMAELDVLQSTARLEVRGVDHEFPLPFEFHTHAKDRSMEEEPPMNRKGRRTAARAARRKK